jgi:recombinational DNA repair ATPase RecF
MIKSITLEGFRGHSRKLEFGKKLNMVRGQNEAGKSTIKEAIAFAWYGTDSSGAKSSDHLITIGQSTARVSIETERVTLTRQKGRGATAKIQMQRPGFPPVVLTQSELAAQMKLSLEAFMSCWNVGYFMGLSGAKQLAVLSELAAVDRRKLLQEMIGYEPPAYLKLASIQTDTTVVAQKRRQEQQVKASTEGALSQLQAQIKQLNETEAIDVDSYQARLNDVNVILEELDAYQKALSLYRSQKTAYDMRMERIRDIDRKRREVQAMLDKVLPPTDDSEYSQIDDEVVQATEMIREKQKLFLKPPQPPAKYTPSVGNCPTCHQKVTAAHVRSLTANYENELAAYNKEARAVEDTNTNLKQQIELFEKIVSEKYEKRKSLLEQDRRSNEARTRFVDELLALDKEGQQRIPDEPKAPKRPDGDDKLLRTEQLEITSAIAIARKQATQLEGLVAQEEAYRKTLKEKDAAIERFKKLEEALGMLVRAETAKTLEALHVPGVKIELKEGELVVSDADGIPYQSLSSGRKLKTNARICARLRTAAGRSAPGWLFLDDADLMDTFADYVPENLQVFVAKVTANCPELTIEAID